METDEILKEVKRLSRLQRACSYYRVDLHVHSPASSDYCGNKDISPFDFISAFATRGFDLIAITDHNTGEYIDDATKARNQIASEVGNNIKVLPGVELNVSPGIHLLAILPDGGSAAISDLLSRLGLQNSEHGNPAKLVSQPIEEIARVVHQREGLLVGAHCNSTHGIVETLDGQTRQDWLSAVDALEINSESGEEKVTKVKDYVTNSLGVSIPFTFGSDSHDCVSESTGMWVKMAEPSLASLRQLTFEPDLRISRAEPPGPSHGRIVGFTTTHGMYANEPFRFSPNLNVLIGGRGAGKSAAIDLIRFAFGAEPAPDDEKSKEFTERIIGFLKSVGEVRVVFAGTDGAIYVVVRSGAHEKLNSRSVPKFSGQPNVYQVIDDDLIPIDKRPLEVLGIEFYGQGEVARLANRVSEQMRLIDENLDHSKATARIAEAEQQLGADERLIVDEKQQLDELCAKAATRRQLEERRDSLQESLADPVFAERTKWDHEKNWIKRYQDWIQSFMDSLPSTSAPPSGDEIDFETSPAKAILVKIRNTSDQLLQTIEGCVSCSRNSIEKAQCELQRSRSEWEKAFEVADEKYRAHLVEIGAESREQAAVQLRSVEQELAHIRNSVEPTIKRAKSRIADLEATRVKLLSSLRDARSEIASSRSKFVEELNAKLGGNVILDLSSCDTDRFYNALDSYLQGSGIMRREEQLELICSSFSVDRFVEIIREKSIDELNSVGITENTASRMFNALADEVLYELERVEVPQLPVIRIKREGETTYTELSSLSVGEKCSAILSIALLSKERPLVIDQPEDDLDHAFITDSIVRGIRDAKSERQIIAASHNPNIPVLGDAELVFRVAHQAGDDNCIIQNSGGLEISAITKDVQTLEGGAEAFERRRKRYSGASLH